MKAISGNKAKALLPVGPRTFIDWQLQWLKRLGVQEAVLAIGFQADEVRGHVEACVKGAPDLYPRTSFSIDKQLGTGGATRLAANTLGLNFVVTYGDSFLFIKPSKLMDEHLKGGKAVTFSIFRNRGKNDASNVAYRHGEIVRYDKQKPTPDMEYIDYGMFAVRRSEVMSSIPTGPSDLATFLSAVCARGDMGAVVASEPFQEIGSPEGYRRFCELMAANQHDLARLEARVR
jgi:NDP-sugar pyrophosphorylase family protein